MSVILEIQLCQLPVATCSRVPPAPLKKKKFVNIGHLLPVFVRWRTGELWTRTLHSAPPSCGLPTLHSSVRPDPPGVGWSCVPGDKDEPSVMCTREQGGRLHECCSSVVLSYCAQVLTHIHSGFSCVYLGKKTEW